MAAPHHHDALPYRPAGAAAGDYPAARTTSLEPPEEVELPETPLLEPRLGVGQQLQPRTQGGQGQQGLAGPPRAAHVAFEPGMPRSLQDERWEPPGPQMQAKPQQSASFGRNAAAPFGFQQSFQSPASSQFGDAGAAGVPTQTHPFLLTALQYLADGQIKNAFEYIFRFGNEEMLWGLLRELEPSLTWPFLTEDLGRHFSHLLVRILCKSGGARAGDCVCWLAGLFRLPGWENLLQREDLPDLRQVLFSLSGTSGATGKEAAAIYYEFFGATG